MDGFLLSFDTQAAIHVDEIKHTLAQRGELIGPMDLLIAATVVRHGTTLITNNTLEFPRIESPANGEFGVAGDGFSRPTLIISWFFVSIHHESPCFSYTLLMA
jgi:hypothetical protein